RRPPGSSLFPYTTLFRSSDSTKVFWRDTHLRIDGPGAHYLQYLFLGDWNFCADEKLQPTDNFFPQPASFSVKGDQVVQIAAGGPDRKSTRLNSSHVKISY